MKRTTFFTIMFLCAGFFSHAQYIDLPSDIAWTGGNVSAGTATLQTVEAGYNHARTQENSALTTSIPSIQFPTQQVWDGMSVNQKALWIVNQERTARGLVPFEAFAEQLISIAQDYTQFMADNDTISHFADGNSPFDRMKTNADIESCMARPAENIAFIFSSNPTPPVYSLERMMYWLIYEDAIANWGHRRSFFTETYIDDSGETGKEGIMGTGFVIAENFIYKGTTWNYAAISTFKMFDPCANWIYPPPTLAKNIANNDSDAFELHISNNTICVTHATNEPITHISVINSQGIVISEALQKACIVTPHIPKGIYIMHIKSNLVSTYKKISIAQ
jgi:uncharacterized protein YkwD